MLVQEFVCVLWPPGGLADAQQGPVHDGGHEWHGDHVHYGQGGVAHGRQQDLRLVVRGQCGVAAPHGILRLQVESLVRDIMLS